MAIIDTSDQVPTPQLCLIPSLKMKISFYIYVIFAPSPMRSNCGWSKMCYFSPVWTCAHYQQGQAVKLCTFCPFPPPPPPPGPPPCSIWIFQCEHSRWMFVVEYSSSYSGCSLVSLFDSCWQCGPWQPVQQTPGGTDCFPGCVTHCPSQGILGIIYGSHWSSIDWFPGCLHFPPAPGQWPLSSDRRCWWSIWEFLSGGGWGGYHGNRIPQVTSLEGGTLVGGKFTSSCAIILHYTFPGWQASSLQIFFPGYRNLWELIKFTPSTCSRVRDFVFTANQLNFQTVPGKVRSWQVKLLTYKPGGNQGKTRRPFVL